MQNYIKRDIFTEIKSHLKKPEITMIVGPRQCGKTTLMRHLADSIIKNKQPVLFINLDIEEDNKYIQSQQALLDKIRLEFGDRKVFVFLDEIQKKDNAGTFLKGLYDMGLPHKFIVSGSGNIELKERLSESLMGRKKVFHIKPVLWNEFVNFKTGYKYADRLDEFFRIEEEKTNNLLMEYLSFGGYPKIVTTPSLKDKQDEIKEIFDAYLTKDIVKWLRVEKIDSFERLFRLLAIHIGNLIDFSNMTTSVGVSVKTLKNYIWYLQKTFILRKCAPFFTNKKKEIVKSPIFYFYDLGLRNYSVGQFRLLDDLSQDIGFLFENFIFNELENSLEPLSAKVHFWRTKSQAEVDFVIDFGSSIVPVEVKFKKFTNPKIEKSLQSFISRYSPKQAFVVNKNFDQEFVYKDTVVNFIPFWKVNSIFE